MQSNQSGMMSIRVSDVDREKFKLLSSLDSKPVSQILKELVDKELKSRKLNSTDIRKLPKGSRAAILKQMTDEALPIYNIYKQELSVEETGDGIK
jgi:predicted DNA-binding protein